MPASQVRLPHPTKAFVLYAEACSYVSPHGPRRRGVQGDGRTLTAYLRWGKCEVRFLVFRRVRLASSGDRRLRMARVALGRRSRGW